ncbi:diguanylate cyclase (GGDEF) domain-containing protein [Desulfotomaculum arcticum]|uniref:Diguanylate cyclase (GGDEF) domain-containing protein n=1 Tax=Desulfotruncus arcticus DSM 17038 TaxID=1121424 RepID=A0A1I2UZ54_9FIRM|nr:EAL domain-containing protein [Desulfotruncus arcticus]SFG82525.1 diguanylate cyclase (GGDEF) domain-containing protein [Desulfotomaculum arcticum] [Desulfotruncus arcticus DSM 17038]
MQLNFWKKLLAHKNNNGSIVTRPISKLIMSNSKNINGNFILFYLDIVNFSKFEQLLGLDTAKTVLKYVNNQIHSAFPQMMSLNNNELIIDRVMGDDFIVLCPNSKYQDSELQNIAITLSIALKENINKHCFTQTGWTFDIRVGFSLIVINSMKDLEHQLYVAFREAQKVAHGLLDHKKVGLLEEFKKILHTENVNAVFQPIVSLENGSTLGWEALTRGPIDGHFHSPAVLFSFAEEVDMLYPLERLCRKKAISAIGDLNSDQKLFLNINPGTISDPNFVSGETLKYIDVIGVKSNNIVFEITEHTDAANFPNFRKTLNHYRDQGYMVAVDDVGSGFSSLSTIALIRPDFLKMDMSLVQGISYDPVKKALMETIVIFAEKIGCKIIAEGIESETDLNTVMDLGVHYGQGYIFARPEYPKPNPEKKVVINILNTDLGGKRKFWRYTIPVSDIMEKCHTVGRRVLVKEVKEFFSSNPNEAGVVVLENNKPLGIVMKQDLYQELSTLYGMSLYLNKPIETIMDKRPLMVDSSDPIQVVSQMSMSRESSKLYDIIVITSHGEYAGILSVQTLLDAMTRIQLEYARRANPLTGLPGNKMIEDEINTRLSAGENFSLIYCDLNNFKSYNDKYGFEEGDRIILLTSRIIQHCVNKYDSKNSFVGHIGGDDFIVIVGCVAVEKICRRIIRLFDRIIPQRYDPLDRQHGCIQGKDRDGNDKCFPIIAISMAIIDCGDKGQASSLQDIVQLSAELKKYAKTFGKSVFTRDRRYKENQSRSAFK